MVELVLGDKTGDDGTDGGEVPVEVGSLEEADRC